MGLFDRFRRKENEKVRIGRLDQIDVIPLEEDIEIHEDQKGRIYDELQRALIKRLEEQKRLNEKMAQVYPLRQKVILWFDGKETRIKGYPIAMRKDFDEYVILYQVRPPDWLDSIWYSLGRILGKQPPQKLIRAHEELVFFGEETITIFARAFKVNLIGEEEAIPIEHNPIEAELYIVMKQSRDAWRSAYMHLARQVAAATDLALNINPRVKVYWKDKTKNKDKGTEEEHFGGKEISFADNIIRRELYGE